MSVMSAIFSALEKSNRENRLIPTQIALPSFMFRAAYDELTTSIGHYPRDRGDTTNSVIHFGQLSITDARDGT